MRKLGAFLVGLGIGVIVMPIMTLLWLQWQIERDMKRWGYPI